MVRKLRAPAATISALALMAIGAATGGAASASTTGTEGTRAPGLVYGAVAYAPSVSVVGKGVASTLQLAKTFALTNCRAAAWRASSAQVPYRRDCALYTWVYNGWIVVAAGSTFQGPGRPSPPFGTGHSLTVADALARARQVCQRYGGHNCIPIAVLETERVKGAISYGGVP